MNEEEKTTEADKTFISKNSGDMNKTAKIAQQIDNKLSKDKSDKNRSSSPTARSSKEKSGLRRQDSHKSSSGKSSKKKKGSDSPSKSAAQSKRSKTGT